MTDLDVALSALAPPGIALKDARSRVPPVPTLYAIYGGPDIWRMLGLGGPPVERPLYIGKAENSLVARDLDTLRQRSHRIVYRPAVLRRVAPARTMSTATAYSGHPGCAPAVGWRCTIRGSSESRG